MNASKTEQRMVEGCHILAGEGQGDLIWGHLSARTGDDGDFLMKPAGIGLDDVEAGDLIIVNAEGEKTSGKRPLHVEVFIHSEILKARPEIQAVVHTHPIHATTFSALGRPLLPIGHEGAMFCEGLPVFDETSDLIVTSELGKQLAATLGNANAALLRNHGVVTVGRSVEEAVMTAILLEKACRAQLLAEASGEIRHFSDIEEARNKKKRVYAPAALELAFQYCARRHYSHKCACNGNANMAGRLNIEAVQA